MSLSTPARALGLALGVDCAASCGMSAAAAPQPDRTRLPIAEPARPAVGELDVRNATLPPRFEVQAPENAPNVIVILVDDLGFAGTSAFGGPIATPTFDRMAEGGLRHNNFHTTAVSSPTRAAIKSGRNHHAPMAQPPRGVLIWRRAKLWRSTTNGYPIGSLGWGWLMGETSSLSTRLPSISTTSKR
jgi:hypothetical protein